MAGTPGKVPSALACGLCQQLCKRGVKLACCSAPGCRACATKAITRDKKCWSCGKEALSKDLLNDDDLRRQVETFQKGEWREEAGGKKEQKEKEQKEAPPPVAEAGTQEQEFVLAAEEEVKARAAKKAKLKRELKPDDKEKSPKKRQVLSEVSLDMMKQRNEEFDSRMNSVEKASKELRFGAQLELMFTFRTEEASCRMCGEQMASEKDTQAHLQQAHKAEYAHIKTVLSPPNNNMLQLCLQKALKSEFLFAREQTFPVAVNY